MSPAPNIAKYCLKCRYNLRGLPAPRCPECGTPFDPDDHRTYHVSPDSPLTIALVFALIIFLLFTSFVLFRFLGNSLMAPRAGPASRTLRVAAVGRTGPIANALTKYRFDTGHYPTTEQGLAELILRSKETDPNWRGPYVTDRQSLNDPWGNPYQYRSPATHNKDGYDLWSTGPDRIDATPDDITNWTGS